MSGGTGGDAPPSPRTAAMRLHMDALTRRLEGMIQRQHDENLERFERIEKEREARNSSNGESASNEDRKRERRRRERRRRDDEEGNRGDRLEGVRINIPSFKGKNDPEAYLDWEMKVEQIFSCHNYSDEKKVKVAALEFTDYALIWWDQLVKERRRYEEPPMDSWDEMKRLMRRRFVPSTYHRELHNKLQRLTQGSKTVDEYFKEMEIGMIRANVTEEREATLARFLSGLNKDIRDVVDLHHYMDLNDLVHKATKVEKQFKEKNYFKKGSNFNSPSWKDKSKKEGSTKPKEVGTTPGKAPMHSNEPNSNTRNRDIKCFKCLGKGHIASQCPNRRVMVVKKDGNITSESSDNSTPTSEDESDSGEERGHEGDLLMVRRLLGSKMKVYDETQRENIFHTRCLIQGKTCLLIIDGGSCTNVASTRLVSKLNLNTKPHPRPYKLQWLSEDEEMLVDTQVDVEFGIGKYKDTILCDVVPMEASHVLLGRPWQYDKEVNHDGRTNKYSFMYNNHKMTLAPLSPMEVSEDQIKMKEKRELERKEMKEKEKKKSQSGQEQKKKKERGESEKKERKVSLLGKESEVKRALLSQQPLYMLYCKETTLYSHATNDLSLSSGVETILQDFGDVFPKEVPNGLPPLRCIEHHIDLVPGATLPNKPAYRSNPQETKEMQK